MYINRGDVRLSCTLNTGGGARAPAAAAQNDRHQTPRQPTKYRRPWTAQSLESGKQVCLTIDGKAGWLEAFATDSTLETTKLKTGTVGQESWPRNQLKAKHENEVGLCLSGCRQITGI